jgi:hypothetical protein
VSLNESILEDAALTWFAELGYAVGHGPQFAPSEPAGEPASFAERVLVGGLCEVIRRSNLAIPSRTLATLPDTLLPKLLSGELRVAEVAKEVPA